MPQLFLTTMVHEPRCCSGTTKGSLDKASRAEKARAASDKSASREWPDLACPSPSPAPPPHRFQLRVFVLPAEHSLPLQVRHLGPHQRLASPSLLPFPTRPPRRSLLALIATAAAIEASQAAQKS